MAGDPNGLEYKIHFYVSSNATDVPRWLQLQFQLNGKYFRILVSSRRLVNSPSRLAEFDKHFINVSELSRDSGTVVASDKDDEVDVNLGKVPREIKEFFKWIVDPFLPKFTELAPRHPPRWRLTLQDRYFCDSFDCLCEAKDDVLTLSPITPCPDKHESYLHGDFDETTDAHLAPVDPRFRIFMPQEVSIYGSARRMMNRQVKKVCVDGQDYLFKCVGDVANAVTNLELARYAEIESANFAPELRISRLAGIVPDDRRDGHPRVLGLLLHYIDEEERLSFYLLRDTSLSLPDDARLRIIAQLCEAVRALHAKDITWGDAHYDCVILDKDRNPWLVDFGSILRIRGYIHEMKRNTKEGDLQGLGNIIDLLLPESDY
ncbi:hypothetical protein NQ176_g9019 [Zarea fungicola]|uniref:Uncharacterized protein n=1 Tax=Zarea fungicola TaxID=93591 RepID=A0ACC1MPM4_9HYPO|nr:hypothetical protein NQ176_g9019 [Lecanicillium fungicola]